MDSKPDTESELVAQCGYIAEQTLQGRNSDQIREELIARQVPLEMIPVLIEMTVQAGIAGEFVRKGMPAREALTNAGIPAEHHDLAEKVLAEVMDARGEDPFDTVATNAGCVDLQLWSFLKLEKAAFVLFGVTLLGLSAISLVVGLWLLWEPSLFFTGGFAILYVWLMKKFWEKDKDQFKYGCVNPGVIVSTNPPMIAVYGNLSQSGAKEFPVVKVLLAEISASNVADFRVGARIATIATYSEGENPERWTDFNPVPVNCATRNKSEIKRVADSIEESAWIKAEQAINSIPDKLNPALHEIASQ